MLRYEMYVFHRREMRISWKQIWNKEAQRYKNIGYFKLADVFNVTMQFHAKAAMWSSRVVILT